MRIGVSTTVASIVDKVAAQLRTGWYELRLGNDLAAAVSDANRERRIVVAITDENSAVTEPFVNHLAALGATPNVSILVGTSGRRGDAPAPRTTPAAPAAPASGTLTFDLSDPDMLATLLSRCVTRRRAAMMESDPVVKIVDDDLRNAADRNGISVASRPGLDGPGGGRA
jgi:hypothetical protein